MQLAAVEEQTLLLIMAADVLRIIQKEQKREIMKLSEKCSYS